ncbi:DUF6531 domain-containing protein [Pseudomonas protegens]|uniref:DUF6531 domain-containing protein n=1 Tax=Pseudomonas protegens TaxID=380021 RepID=UPI00382325D8
MSILPCPAPYPFNWTRTCRSSLSAYDDDELGARWITPLTTRLDLEGEGLRYHAADGRSFDYSLPKVGGHHDDRVENLTLTRISDRQIALCRGLDRRETYRRDGKRFLDLPVSAPLGDPLRRSQRTRHQLALAKRRS